MQKLTLALLLTTQAFAAPLFPSQREAHWAADALARLREKGLIQGYSDGSYKGDRAMSRYEVAWLLARLLQHWDQSTATLASKAELRLVEELCQQLKPELAQLGVRLTALEESTSRLEQRVTQLEALKFYGSIESRILTQSFNHQGAAGTSTFNLHEVVGGSLGPALRPQVHGLIPVVDYRNGRALLNGVGFSSKALLGIKTQNDSDHEFGLELAAYTAQGNSLIDAYWGVNAPYLANPWTANQVVSAGGQEELYSPWSRAVFEKAYYLHKPSHTRVTLGAFDSLRMDPFIYAGQGNNNAFGPGRFPGFGIQVWSEFQPQEDVKLQLELFGSRFGDGGNLFAGTNYAHVVLGGDLGLHWGHTEAKLNWARYYDESPDFSGPLVGLDNITNVAYLNSPGWTQTQWVNPPGHFALQRSAQEIATTGVLPNRVDTRPIGGWQGGQDNALGFTSGGGNFGSQAQTTYGLSLRHWLPLDENKEGVKLNFEAARSEYKSNRNSGYISRGNLVKGEVAAVLDEGRLNLQAGAMRIDPTYNPALFNAALLGIRFPRSYNFIGRYQLFDSANYPQNREGLTFKGSYQWQEPDLKISFKANFLRQVRTSLYDVRVLGGALGPGIPTQDVIGFAPGFFDPVFAGFAHPNLYGKASGNSFSANLQPLENPRGSLRELGFGLHHHWADPDLALDFNLESSQWNRPTRLSPAQGGSQNRVDLTSLYGQLALNWKFADDWNLRGGAEWVHVYGHHDPGGLYNGFANASGQVNFRNIDSMQWIPGLGVDYQMSKTSSCSLDFRYYSTQDGVNASITRGTGDVIHPFSWRGPQLSGVYKLTF